MLIKLLICALALLGLSPTPLQQDAASDSQALEGFEALLEQNRIHIDVENGICAIPVVIEVRNDLLEYLLVAPNGAVHESMLVTAADPKVLNLGLLALGVTPGTNASWTPKEPAPTAEQLAAGERAYDVELPTGDGFYLYASWMEGEELFFYRIEDLLRDLERSRSARRHRWTYIGSRMIQRPGADTEEYAASLEGNLINVSFFSQGNTLLTASLEECVEQTIWLPNAWLLPERGSEILFMFSRERLTALPATFAAHTPRLGPAQPETR